MSSFPPPQPPPPPPPTNPSYPRAHLHKRPATSLPDFLFTALSLFLLFSSSKPALSTYTHFPVKLSFSINRRRFLSITNMSFPSTASGAHKFPHFPTPQSLSDWLKPRLPSDSFAAWGVKPGTKNIHNLWLELSEGEISLADSIPPVRNVEVVVVRVIGKQGKLLVESHQELSNGDIRNRCRPLSEKMKPGESVEAAVYRAVKEELGSIANFKLGYFGNFGCGVDDGDVVKIIPGSYTKKVEERYSESYPGLPACYVLHTVDAVVEGLPEGEFCTEEFDEYGNFDGERVANGALLCKKHFWKWVDADSLR